MQLIITFTHNASQWEWQSAGALGKDAAELGGCITVITGELHSTEILLYRLTVAVQCRNAACVLGMLSTLNFVSFSVDTQCILHLIFTTGQYNFYVVIIV